MPEIGNDPVFARYFFDVLGAQGLGSCRSASTTRGYSNFPLGAKNIDEAIDAFARPYRSARADGARMGAPEFHGESVGRIRAR